MRSYRRSSFRLTLLVTVLLAAVSAQAGSAAVVPDGADRVVSVAPSNGPLAVGHGGGVNAFAHAPDVITVLPAPCPPVITTNTTLAADCLGPITIGASGVHLNLGGHTVTCGGVVTTTGITVIGLTGVRISNGTVRECGAAIRLRNGGTHHLSNLNLVANRCCGPSLMPPTGDSNFGDGVQIRTSNSNDLVNLRGTGNGISVFMWLGSQDNVLRSSDLSGGAPFSSVEIQDSDFNEIRGTTLRDSVFEGLLVSFGGNGNVVHSTTATNNNNGFDIGFTGGADNVIQSSRAEANRGHGIVLTAPATRTLIRSNTVLANRFGIRVGTGATANTIMSNRSLGNTLFDMSDDNPNCDANIWRSNTFVTANQPACIH